LIRERMIGLRAGKRRVFSEISTRRKVVGRGAGKGGIRAISADFVPVGYMTQRSKTPHAEPSRTRIVSSPAEFAIPWECKTVRFFEVAANPTETEPGMFPYLRYHRQVCCLSEPYNQTWSNPSIGPVLSPRPCPASGPSLPLTCGPNRNGATRAPVGRRLARRCSLTAPQPCSGIGSCSGRALHQSASDEPVIFITGANMAAAKPTVESLPIAMARLEPRPAF